MFLVLRLIVRKSADGLPGVVAVLRSGAFRAVASGLVCRVFRWCFE